MPTEPSNYDWHLSPKYTFQQYRRGDVGAIDVFEDQIRGWVLSFAEKLAREEHSGIAVLMLATSYFEPIERFRSGRDDDDEDSGKVFKASIRRVFSEIDAWPSPERGSGILFDQLRGGLFHAGLIKPLLVLVAEGEPIQMELAGGKLRAIKINPKGFIRRVTKDFDCYISELRDGTDQSASDNFNKMWRKRGGLENSGKLTDAPSSRSGLTQTETGTNTSPSIDPSRFTREM